MKSIALLAPILLITALAFADESPEPPVEELTQHVYLDEIG